MDERLTRQNIKRNELGEAVAHGIEYAEHHLRQIFVSFGVIVAVAAAIWGGYAWVQHRRGAANDLLAQALHVWSGEVVATGAQPDDPFKPTFATEGARRAKAEELFTKLHDSYGRTGAGALAQVYLGEIALAEGDAAKARSLWQDYVDDHGSEAPASVARIDLMQLDRKEGKGTELVEKLRAMLDKPQKSLPDDLVLYQLGETLDVLGRKDEARSSFRRIVEEFPQSPWVEEARRRSGGAAAGNTPMMMQ
jgi:tetratricopeptide (TPR) repeat protein